MANAIDELVIKIKADTKQLQSELKKIEGKIKVTGTAGGAAFGSMAGSLAKIKGPAIAAAAGIAILGIGMKSIANVGSQFEDLQDSLNQVFGGIEQGSKAFDKVLEFAQTTPFQIETVTKAFIGLKSAGIEPNMDMLQTFADTASSATDQLGTFEALIRVIQRSAAGGMSLVELNQIADRGIDVFGGLKEELGLSRDELSKFGKTAEGAKIIQEALIKSLDKKFGGAMAAKMDNLSTKTSNMVIAFKGLADEVFKSGLGDFLKDIADRLSSLANAIGKTIRAVGGRKTIQDITGESGKDEQILKLRELIKEQEDKRDTAQASIDKNYGGQVIADRRIALAKIIELNTLLDGLETKVLKTGKEVDTSLSTLLQSDIDFMDDFKKLVEDSIPQLEQIQTQMDSVEAMRGKLNEEGTLIASDEEIERILTMLGLLKEEMGQTGEVTDAMAETLERATDQFANDFINALQNGENALVSFRNLVGDMIQQVIAEFLKMQVIKPMMNALFTAVGLPTMPTGKAGGGTIQGGRATLVGERGPEIFVPNTGGTIMNNMNSKNAMGGGGTTVINQSINFATGIVPTVRAEVTKMMPQIADVTKAAVQEASMRGGSYRRSLLGG